jgi:hypothetical protein
LSNINLPKLARNAIYTVYATTWAWRYQTHVAVSVSVEKWILGKLLFQAELVNTANTLDYTNWSSQQQQQNMPDLGHPMLTMQSRCRD